jgi:hypothetical protein
VQTVHFMPSFMVKIALLVQSVCLSIQIHKDKDQPRTCHEGTVWEYRYSSTLPFTSALDGGWMVSARPWLPYLWAREPVLILQEVVGAPWPARKGVENHAPSGLDPWAVQPIRSRYAD